MKNELENISWEQRLIDMKKAEIALRNLYKSGNAPSDYTGMELYDLAERLKITEPELFGMMEEIEQHLSIPQVIKRMKGQDLDIKRQKETIANYKNWLENSKFSYNADLEFPSKENFSNIFETAYHQLKINDFYLKIMMNEIKEFEQDSKWMPADLIDMAKRYPEYRGARVF
jgi:hypothetical protein